MPSALGFATTVLRTISWARESTFSVVIVSSPPSHRPPPSRVILASFDDTCENHNHSTVLAYVYADYVRYHQPIHAWKGENTPAFLHGFCKPCARPWTCQLILQSILSIVIYKRKRISFQLVRKTNLHRAMSVNASRSSMHYQKHVEQGITGCTDGSTNTISL